MPAVIAIVGGGNTGKTTLIEKLIPVLKERGFRVGTVKHVAHDFSIDPAGKDSWRHAAAGADTVVVDANTRLLVLKPIPPISDTDRLLKTILDYFEDVDVVLAEGYKSADVPKIEVFRGVTGSQPICLGDPNLLAVLTDNPEAISGILRLDIDDISSIADLLEKQIASTLPPQ